MNSTLTHLVYFVGSLLAVWTFTLPAALYNQATPKELAETAAWGVVLAVPLAFVFS
jgi:hypothetical protein